MIIYLKGANMKANFEYFTKFLGSPCPIIVYFVASYRPKIILNPYLLEFFLTQKSENVRPHSNNY